MAKESVLLVIAGFDPSGGAGIVADLETIHKLGGKAAVAVTAITVQNSYKFGGFNPIEASILTEQLDAIFDEYRITKNKFFAKGKPEQDSAFGMTPTASALFSPRSKILRRRPEKPCS